MVDCSYAQRFPFAELDARAGVARSSERKLFALSA